MCKPADRRQVPCKSYMSPNHYEASFQILELYPIHILIYIETKIERRISHVYDMYIYIYMYVYEMHPSFY